MSRFAKMAIWWCIVVFSILAIRIVIYQMNEKLPQPQPTIFNGASPPIRRA